ncbi:hypothetical protein RB594_003124 [Gaeumannomyces avenae]
MDIVLDFDGTITAKDTIACLGAFAVSRQQQSQQQQQQQQQHHYDDHGGHPTTTTTTTTTTEHHQDSASTSTSRQATWDWIVSSYAADHARHAAAFEPAEADRRTVAAERAFLASLRAVDGASAARVARSRLFVGCTDAHLFEAGRDAVRASAGAAAAFRPGFAAFLRDAAGGGGGGGATVSVLSVNWSAAFIRGVVSMCDGPGGDGAAAVVSEVISNDIMADGSIGGPPVRGPEGEGGGGDRHAALTTSADKLRVFLDRRDSRGARGARTTVYFGDSTTDLECLLEASAGVVMADEGGAEGSSALLRCLSRLGFHVPHVSEAAAAAAAAAGLPPPRLAWARDFCEVMDSGHLAKLAAAGTASPAPKEEEEGEVAEANVGAASLER